MESIFEILKAHLPTDHSQQVTAEFASEKLLQGSFVPSNILDLGCGVGASARLFRRIASGVPWTGVDIEESPEVNARTSDTEKYVTFNGVNLPFEDGHFDLVYSNQVLEHVRHPEKLLREVRRVLSDDGYFVGQTSQLEPYHSYSYWNFTIFGFKVICEDAGLSLLELRPGIDSKTLIERSYLGRPKEYSRWFSEQSPLNEEIENTVRENGRSTRVANFRKLMYCGQFVFLTKKRSAEQ